MNEFEWLCGVVEGLLRNSCVVLLCMYAWDALSSLVNQIGETVGEPLFGHLVDKLAIYMR